ncbi:hypothetical protein GCM10023335_22970 [Streptomyces siamensis]|uniref:Uncharacterized protein n=1 Tax=Streptomyces siamensis TaxID=1274986 RepID=A0ABP9IQD1_9ACTN
MQPVAGMSAEVHVAPAEVHVAPAEVHAVPAEVHAVPLEVHATPAAAHAVRSGPAGRCRAAPRAGACTGIGPGRSCGRSEGRAGEHGEGRTGDCVEAPACRRHARRRRDGDTPVSVANVTLPPTSHFGHKGAFAGQLINAAL